ncbi:MAG: hypothetical protein M3186_16995 [Actinomycetota bacterium]|nr:hypothetical protein [Actinomycetota bacterium]
MTRTTWSPGCGHCWPAPEGQSLGRRAVTRRLDVTEHQARIAMELVTATTGPVLNGTGRRAKLRAAGRGAR